MQQDPRRSNRVRALREDRLMTREELAERSGLSVRTVWSVENGYPCRLLTKRRILRALGLSSEDHTRVFPSPARHAAPGDLADGAEV
jgi:DNA-binding XRE family transcriptional regulator